MRPIFLLLFFTTLDVRWGRYGIYFVKMDLELTINWFPTRQHNWAANCTKSLRDHPCQFNFESTFLPPPPAPPPLRLATDDQVSYHRSKTVPHHYSALFVFGFSSHHAVHTPLWSLGLPFLSYGLFLIGAMVALYFSSNCSIILSASFSFSATLVYSHGSSRMLKRHGPSWTPHFAGSAGCGPHVTTAFFRVGRESEKLRGRCAFSSRPGGGYQPSWLWARKR